MAMIKCPKCGEGISDKSTTCIHCGHVLIEESKVFCEECGAEIEKNEEICSKCGCPVNKQSENVEQQEVEGAKATSENGVSKKKLIIGIVAVLAVIGIIFGAVSINKHNEEQRAKELAEQEEQKAKELAKQYEKNLNTIVYKMLNGAADAESCGNKIKKVWSNTIWEDDDPETDKYTKTNGVFNEDFNTSLTALFTDPDFMKTIDDIEKNQSEVNKIMKDMKNPPEEWEDAYNDLKEYYDNYLILTNLCINPSGSLQTFSTNFNDADTDTINSFNKMKTYLDY
ncbi:zinc-ribbon domain-containing protein [Thomasclavelia cocleata]|jgi:type II secretory pathway pseudopilin PulG/ribosomal protein L37E|uniref:Double zinc ribbon n=1 Tax=Thomasclavelia cocleata TaxID=69824 RepID=A0A1I0D117_9FIRM|nr:zinc-ribbon domain-containing protein [Thomasclavelia cocleata]MCR1959736.1 zinc-ribbon domain-containing protein [Thomasclavelia cocleata]NDO41076.1 zinc-ribbon domain-containing protein [Thomasclavelia cocleata]PJN81603.1 hypothetical protein CWE04_01720 [Thomasclavelia cocleata]SET25435.1 Double zinc ribbon [Thomasclavelia cocleata]